MATVRSPHYPEQIVWGARDAALSWRYHGVQAQLAAGVERRNLAARQALPARRFCSRDRWGGSALDRPKEQQEQALID
ncbi:MAG: haloalkane dehalogenase [Mycobacterium sp.]|nr:haloalkane dehalogenase [Mycobacterium sp.]